MSPILSAVMLTAVSGSASGMLSSVIMFVIMATVFYFALIRPAQKTAKNKSQSAPTVASKDTFSRVEKLTKLKELLDSDVITQEEFDQKKKELLNL